MSWRRPLRLAVKLSDTPAALAFANPYPGLEENRGSQEREWGWTLIPGKPIPDLGPAVEIAQRVHPATGPTRLGQVNQGADQIVSDASDRVAVVPRCVDEVEQVEMAEWVSGWLSIGSVGDTVAGYARLADGPLGQVIASFTLLIDEGFGSTGYSPGTVRFLRYDPARDSVDYLAHVEEIIPGWSLEGAIEVGDDFAVDFDESGPDVIFQHLIDAYPDLDVYALSLQQAQDMGWHPYADDRTPPPVDHLWRPVDLSAN